MKLRSGARFALESVEGAVVTVATLLSWPVARRWLRNWGALPSERDTEWPGDALVSRHHFTYTRAIGIDAPPDRVWPWLVQFGLGRAGFYSYELLERIVGIPVRNVESIVPGFQGLSVGDEVQLHPDAPGIPVAVLEEERHICYGVALDDTKGDEPHPGRSWSMYLREDQGNRTRLVLRGCIEPLKNPSFANRLGGMFEGPVDFIMEQRMLRTLKRLASGEVPQENRRGLEGGGTPVGESPRLSSRA